MNDTDLIKLYDIVKDIELKEEQKEIVNRLSIVVEQINLSYEYREKLTAIQNKLKGCDNNVEK